jgi:tetratricopeptide (TPR) repeat protein
MSRIYLVMILFIATTTTDAYGSESSIITSAIVEADKLISSDRKRDALNLLIETRKQFPDNIALIESQATLLFSMGRIGETRNLITASDASPALDKLLAAAGERFERYTRNYAIAMVAIPKRMDVEDFTTAIAIADLALQKFPEREQQFLALKGEALYKNNELEAAEIELRKALNLDPLDDVSKGYVAEIRSTRQAQISEGWAEWVLIFKDKVGDFVVTFLALFAAFLVNSLMAPIGLRIKLNHARRSFERGNYDEFTDMIEGLLDQENFSILRSNFRFVLNQKGYEDAREILNRYVVTLERLPSLLRILEREHEKMLENA